MKHYKLVATPLTAAMVMSNFCQTQNWCEDCPLESCGCAPYLIEMWPAGIESQDRYDEIIQKALELGIIEEVEE